jgi:hypothetical protein
MPVISLGKVQMEPTTGIEPVNLFLTKEVLYLLSYVGLRVQQPKHVERVHRVMQEPWSCDQAKMRPIDGFGAFILLHVVPTIMTDSWSATISYSELGGGEGRIRTSEGFAGRFTVCSLWPLGNLTTKRQQLPCRASAQGSPMS